MALPNYTSRSQVRQDHPNWNQPRVQRTWDRTRSASAPATQPMTSPATSTQSPAPAQQAIYDPATSTGPASTNDYQYTSTPYAGPYTTPTYTQDHPFYDPNSTYWQPGQPNPYALQPGSEEERAWSNQNPQSYYYAMLNRRGLGGFDANSQTAQSMYRDAMAGYSAAQMKNMELDVSDYLDEWDVEDILRNMTSEQRGINTNQFRGRNRWGMRAV